MPQHTLESCHLVCDCSAPYIPTPEQIMESRRRIHYEGFTDSHGKFWPPRGYPLPPDRLGEEE